MKVLIIIPAYNEELNIKNAVETIKRTCKHDFIVVNDGSSDNTAGVCRENEYPLLDLPVNLGLAGAFQTGMRYAYEKGYDAAIQIDGDGQHKPEFITTMITAMEESGSDIVIGSRFVSSSKPKSMRMFGSNLIEFAVKITTRKTIKDPTSGMRLYGNRVLELFANNINFGPEPDTIAHLIRAGAEVMEVQVEMQERTAGTSYLTAWKSARYMINMFTSILFLQYFRTGDINK